MPANPDSPAATYISAAISRNSIDHFVLLMTPPERRPVVAASISLAKVIENISRQGAEPAIVQLKLSWWLEEIEMIGRGNPRHPLSIDLMQRLTDQAWLNPLSRYVNGVMSDHARAPFESLTELLPHCHRAAERQAMLAAALPHCDELALTHARQAGVGIRLTQIIRDRADRNGRIPVNGFDGETAAITAARLATIAAEHFQAPGPMTAEQRRAQSAVRLQARLYQLLLERLQRCGYDSHIAVMRPVPLLWHAWREARNLIK